eukprot:scaffold308098_cov33-Tisochrysis_lutea.AAC.1
MHFQCIALHASLSKCVRRTVPVLWWEPTSTGGSAGRGGGGLGSNGLLLVALGMSDKSAELAAVRSLVLLIEVLPRLAHRRVRPQPSRLPPRLLSPLFPRFLAALAFPPGANPGCANQQRARARFRNTEKTPTHLLEDAPLGVEHLEYIAEMKACMN